MAPRVAWGLAFFLAFLATSERQAVAGAPEVDWAMLGALEEQGQWQQAEALCLEVLARDPGVQRAAVEAGVCALQLNREHDALQRFRQAVEIDPLGAWAAKALYYEAFTCSRSDCVPESLQCAVRLRERFPGSVWTTHAERLEGDLLGFDDGMRALLRQRAAADEAADELYWTGRRQAAAGDYPGALGTMEGLLEQLPNTRTAFSAWLSVANIRAKLGDRGGATAAAEHVLATAAPESAASRLVCGARDRLAHLYQLQHRKVEAAQLFDQLAAYSTVPEEVADAKLQAAGAIMEALFVSARDGEPHAGAWDVLRARCAEVLTTPGVTEAQAVRADLMTVESFHWELRLSESRQQAEWLLTRYDGARYPQEAATAHLVAGEGRQVAGDYAGALQHYRWITERFGLREIWPGLDNLARTYFRIFNLSVYTGAPRAEVDAAAFVVLRNWPRSRYADLIRRTYSARRSSDPRFAAPLAEP